MMLRFVSKNSRTFDLSDCYVKSVTITTKIEIVKAA